MRDILNFQNRQNRRNPAASVEETSEPKILGITGYRLLGLLLAIAGLIRAALSVKGVSGPLKMADLVFAGVFGIMYGLGLSDTIHPAY